MRSAGWLAFAGMHLPCGLTDLEWFFDTLGWNVRRKQRWSFR